MNKKVLALLLVLLMVVSVALVGCDGNKPAEDTSKPATEGTKTEDTKKEDTKKDEPAMEEPIELIWFMGSNVPNDQEVVEAALNEISLEKINATMKTLYKENDAMMLSIQSGEPFDIAFTCEWYNKFSTQSRAGYFADITEKVQTVTPDLYATMPEVVWEGAKVDGKILAIPVKKDYAAEIFYRFDKALFVEELGMEVPDNMSFEAVEEYLKAAKDAWAAGNAAAEQAEFPLKLRKGGFPAIDGNFDMINRDVLIGLPYSAVGTADENTVVVTVETPDVYDRLVKLHEWYNAEYINQDAANVDDVGTYSAVKVGQGFYGADAIWSGGDGYVQLISKWSGPFLSTASIRGSMNAIGANSQDIDKALMHQELVNTDVTYRDILRYGVEGTHWDYTDNGLIQKTQVGVDNYTPWPFSQGSYSLSTVQAAEGVDVDPDMWKVIFDGYKDLSATNAIGFSFDITPVETQIAACQNAKDKYWAGLATGTLDPAETVPMMIEEMEAAGLRDIVAEAQAQFDAFVAGK